MNLGNNLEILGLSSREITVYTACLELGMSPIMPIVKKSGIPRSSLSYILEQLQKRNFIEIVSKSSRRLYVATTPRSIVSGLKEEIEASKKRLDSFESILPELNQLFRSNPFQPTVRLFRGAEIRECYSELLENASDEIWNIGETTAIFEVLGTRFWHNWSQKRESRSIKAKAIRVKDAVNETADAFAKNTKFRTIRYAPQGFSCPAHIVICGQSVAIITTTRESFAVMITSHDYAATMKSWFRELWRISTPNTKAL